MEYGKTCMSKSYHILFILFSSYFLAATVQFTTATQIQQTHFPDISVHTVRRRLCENGLKAHAPAKKPILNKRLRTVQCQWAQDHLPWTFEDWTRIAFSEESSFSLSSNSIQYVHRHIGERYDDKCVLSHENQSRGNCIIWGAFKVHDYTPLYRVQGGTLNSQHYIHLLQDALQPYLPTLLPHGGLFQQDNAPAHASRVTKEYLEHHGVGVFHWPSTSPDMNPIEKMWGHMEQILKRDYEDPADSDQLFAMLEEIWVDVMEMRITGGN